MEALILFAVLVVGAAIYFLPSIVAQKRKHRQQTAITVLNLLLGWTFLGWVAAMVWAFGEVKPNTDRQCPFCAEDIRLEAIKCRHCGADLSATTVS